MSDHVLHLGDCLQGLATLADKSVDHVITDPPFASEIYERCKKNPGRHTDTRRGAGSSISLKALADGAIGTMDDVLEGAAKQIARVTKRWAIVFSDVESVHLWRFALAEHGMEHLRTGGWVKKDPMPQFSGDRPANGLEVAEMSYGPGRSEWNGGGKAALWYHGVVKGDARPDHPCPKPLSLMEEIITDFTDPGELICDPFAGSGTTAVACKRLGRRFIGWEKDPKFHAAAVKRIDAARQQGDFFARPPKPKQARLLP